MTINGAKRENCKYLYTSIFVICNKYVVFIIFLKFHIAKLVDAFRVDGIPHIAFITKDARVETALIGAVPEKYLQENMKSLVKVPFLSKSTLYSCLYC